MPRFVGNGLLSLGNVLTTSFVSQDSNNERNAALALAASSSSYGRLSPSTSRLSIVQEPMTSSTPPPSSSITATANCGSNSSSAFSPKWSCPVCTYENWPRSQVCVLCGAKPPLEPACRSESAQHQVRLLLRAFEQHQAHAQILVLAVSAVTS